MAIEIAGQTWENENAVLKAHGFSWKKDGGAWKLLDSSNNPVDKNQVMQDIRIGKIKKPEPIISLIDRPAAVTWARAILNRTQYDKPVYFLDTETTGTSGSDVVIQLAIVDIRGNKVMDFLIHTDVPIQENAKKMHNITEDMLVSAYNFKDLWVTLAPLLNNGEFVIYNASFDMRLLQQTAYHYGLELPLSEITTHCLMKQYAMYHGLTKIGGDFYAYQSLENACKNFDIENKHAHNALNDAIATREVLMAMAKG